MVAMLLIAAYNLALFIYLFGIVLGFGEFGVYIGIVAGDILGGTVGYLWAEAFIRRLIRTAEREKAPL